MAGSRDGLIAESQIRKVLEAELGIELPKARMAVGVRPDGSPNVHVRPVLAGSIGCRGDQGISRRTGIQGHDSYRRMLP